MSPCYVTALRMLRCYSYAFCLFSGPKRAWRPVARPLQNDHIGPVPQPVGRRLSQKAVGEGLLPLLRMKVGGDQGGRRLVTGRHEIVEVLFLILGERFQQEVVDDEKGNLAQRLEPPLEGSGGPGRLQASRELGGSRHQNVVSLPNHLVPQGLGDMALSDPAGTDQKHVGRLPDEVPRLELGDDRPVEMGMAREVEEVQGLSAPEPRPSQALGQKVLLPSGHFVGDQKRQEVLVGQLPVDRLPVALFQGLQQTVETQFLQHGCQFGCGIHEQTSLRMGDDGGGGADVRAKRVFPFR